MAKSKEYEELKAQIKQELEPLLKNTSLLSDKDTSNYVHEIIKNQAKLQESFLINQGFLLNVNAKAVSTSIKEQMFLLYQYLAIVEGIASCVIDMLIILLVVNGKDFHIESTYPPRIRHVYSQEDLEKAHVPLSYKLDFLKYYGIKTFPKLIDMKLRNDIAHLKFKVQKNKVIIRGKRVQDVVIPKLQKIAIAMQLMGEVFSETE